MRYSSAVRAWPGSLPVRSRSGRHRNPEPRGAPRSPRFLQSGGPRRWFPPELAIWQVARGRRGKGNRTCSGRSLPSTYRPRRPPHGPTAVPDFAAAQIAEAHLSTDSPCSSVLDRAQDALPPVRRVGRHLLRVNAGPYRTVHLVQNLGGDGTQQQSSKRTVAVGRHHDQVDLVLVRVARRSGAPDRLPASSRTTGVSENSAPANLSSSESSSRRAGDVQQHHFRAEALRHRRTNGATACSEPKRSTGKRIRLKSIMPGSSARPRRETGIPARRPRSPRCNPPRCTTGRKSW